MRRRSCRTSARLRDDGDLLSQCSVFMHVNLTSPPAPLRVSPYYHVRWTDPRRTPNADALFIVAIAVDTVPSTVETCPPQVRPSASASALSPSGIKKITHTAETPIYPRDRDLRWHRNSSMYWYIRRPG